MIDYKKIKSDLIQKGSKFYDGKTLKYACSLLDEVIDLKLDEESLNTAFFLHIDTTDVEIRKKLESEIGETTVERIDLLKRLKGLSVPETKKKILKLRQLFVELSDDLTVIFIKLAERLFRLKQCEKEKSTELERLAEECLYLYSPIAHRLGIRKIYTEMEGISFKALHPEEYRKIYNRIERKRSIFKKNLSAV